MNGGRLFSVRSARVVAIGRAILALFLSASYLLAPPAQGGLAGPLIGGYLAWSVVLLAITRRPVMIYRLQRAAVLTPVLDLTVFVLLLYATSGADSPYFSPLIFVILAAAIQWGSRGAVMMGLATLLSLAPAGWQVAFGADSDPDAAQIFVLRLGYTAVTSILLMAFARHMERVVEELSRLSGPLPEETDEASPPVEDCLRHALWVFGAQRGLLLWEEREEPRAALASLEAGRFEVSALPPSADDWVAPEVAEAVFLFHRASRTTLVRDGRGTRPGPPQPLAAAILDRAIFERAMVIPVSTGGAAAWIFILDHEEPANEDLAIGAMVGAQVAVAFDRWISQRARNRAIAAEARVRLARDLHDGVLQFLAGARLQLDAMSAGELPDETRDRLAGLRQAVVDEQAELRGFISTLRPGGPASTRLTSLEPDLVRLAERLSRYWSVDVIALVAPPGARVPENVSYDLGRIVREAVANAVRHGGARRIEARVEIDGDRLRLTVEDDGRGFAFEGDMPAGGEANAPWSLQERARGLGGRLLLKSSPQGATVLVDIPLGAR